jgi:hypothetical protein
MSLVSGEVLYARGTAYLFGARHLSSLVGVDGNCTWEKEKPPT